MPAKVCSLCSSRNTSMIIRTPTPSRISKYHEDAAACNSSLSEYPIPENTKGRPTRTWSFHSLQVVLIGRLLKLNVLRSTHLQEAVLYPCLVIKTILLRKQPYINPCPSLFLPIHAQVSVTLLSSNCLVDPSSSALPQPPSLPPRRK